ncbi:PKD domain-containing protein [Candidatus Bipolaricaulota bacterium]|nr:PKD domain-containing protein [Candidatus Bipolaricaulota bacterium]
MKKMAWIVALVLALAATGLGQVEPQGIIIEPPTPEGLTVRIWVDKPAYAIGEYVQVNFEVNRAAYIYIWDILPDGRVQQIFPNQYDQQNYFPAGRHTLPRPGTFRWRVDPPTGTEWLQIMAVTQPIPGIFGGFSVEIPFPILSPDPLQFQVQIQGLVPEPAERAFDFTSFEIVSGAAPGYGTLVVNTTPSLARLYVDGVFRGWTPRTLNLTAGFHDVLIRKSGYQDYSTRVFIIAGRTRTLDVALTPLAVNQPPVAQFTYSPTAPRPGDWVQFNGAGSYDPDGTITSYQWDFQNDGVFDATGQVVYYQFLAPGTYTVRLVVTDNQGATGQITQPLAVTALNQPPVAQFTYTPPTPLPGTSVTFNGTGSYDPDGSIIAYQWDLNGDGVVDRTGAIVTWTYTLPGTYNVTLYVMDNMGATGQTTRPVTVGWTGIPGMPPMFGIPGIYVWGTDTWRITVNGASTWTTPHAYRIELRTDGQFVGVSTEAGPSPLGLIPEPTTEGWRLVFEGSVVSNRVTYAFQVTGATSIYLDLRLDMDGDGNLDRSSGFVRLRQLMVSPPTNPLVVGVPEGYTGALVPSLNFRIGMPISYTDVVRIVWWQTTIGALEGI